ncbi:unnamed protein product [Caenorhabditis bovis]|uniref:Uncharacterized protein n=1 Tax=Caenorhabditis bovis TaxID=2654633 RepID=A0A8S1F6K2_9PELO|nr:unnamed protein product [Caenorhabditis bovis]
MPKLYDKIDVNTEIGGFVYGPELFNDTNSALSLGCSGVFGSFDRENDVPFDIRDEPDTYRPDNNDITNAYRKDVNENGYLKFMKHVGNVSPTRERSSYWAYMVEKRDIHKRSSLDGPSAKKPRH